MLAQEEARLLNHSFIGTEHILLGLIHEQEGIAAKALESLGVSLEAVRARVNETISPAGAGSIGSPPFTPRAKKVLELSLREALQLGHSYIGTEHMLLGLAREGEGVAATVLVSLGADLGRVRRQVITLMSGNQGTEPAGTAQGTGSPENPSFVRRHNSPRARLVMCSFCGLAPPASGQLVSGDNAFICERCIQEWARAIRHRTPVEVRPTIWPPESPSEVIPTGPPPDDQDRARAEIATAFANHGTASADGASAPHVERGEDLGPTLAMVKERNRAIAPEDAEVVISVPEIVFIDAEHAAVWFSVSINGRTALPRRRGDAVVVDDMWKMARSTFCQIMSMGGVPCPPDHG